MSKEGKSLGRKGEDLSVDFLKGKGYKIIHRNYRAKLGEVDIIAEDNGVLCFVEVKTRGNKRFGLGKESVSWAKQRQVTKTAVLFLKENDLLNRKARFDVVSVDYSGLKAEVNLTKNAFELSGGFSY